MKNIKKKIVVIALVVAILAMSVASATIAYFTDTSAQTNTFTVGDVNIDLGTNNDVSFDNVYPGQTLKVNGVITNSSAKDGVYVAGIIEIAPKAATVAANEGDPTKITDMLKADENVIAFLNGLKANVDETTVGTKIVIDYATGKITVYVVLDTALAEGSTFALFNDVKVPASWDKAEMTVLANTALTVKAYATQTAGFAENAGSTAIDAAFGGGADSTNSDFYHYFH